MHVLILVHLIVHGRAVSVSPEEIQFTAVTLIEGVGSHCLRQNLCTGLATGHTQQAPRLVWGSAHPHTARDPNNFPTCVDSSRVPLLQKALRIIWHIPLLYFIKECLLELGCFFLLVFCKFIPTL